MIKNVYKCNIHQSHGPYGDVFSGTKKNIVGGFNPIEKYYSKGESFPSIGENKKYLKPPPRNDRILGSDTTKDGNPLCFFVVVGSACAVESNHRNVGERCLETKRWRFRKLWISSFTFVIAIHLSSFIIIHHSLPCS